MTGRLGAACPVLAAALLVLAPCAARATTGSAARVGHAEGASVRVEPLAASFVTATEGFVLGVAPCATGTCTTLVATTDGGRRWDRVPAPPAPLALPPTGEAAVAVDAVDRILFTGASGYAYGPGLWATAATPVGWEALHPGGPVLDLAVDAGDVWAVVASCWPQDAGCVAPAVRLARAPVGTRSWRVVPGVGGFYGDRLLVRGATGWVATWPRRLPAPVTIWRTTDSGASWSRIPDPCYRPAWAIDLAELASPGGSTLFELCAGNPGTGQETKRVLESTDGGSSVRSVGAAPDGGLVEELSAPSASLLVLAASSAAGLLARSADGGRHWTVTTLGDGGVGLSGLSFVSPSVGFVLDGRPSDGSVPDRLLVTRDGGLTWSVVAIATQPATSAGGRVGPGVP